MARKEKEILVKDLGEKFKNNNGIVLTEYQGLNVLEINELRNKLRPAKCDYKVVKNTLTKKALKDLGLEEFSNLFIGPTAIAIERGDPVEATKVLVNFSKDHKNLKLKAGMLGNKILTPEQIKSLANLPSRLALLAQVIGTIQSPISGLVNALNGVILNLVNVLDQIKKQKEENK
ncbi:MAG: 50S ribosomal protein L10 [Elusimicrobia bacterium]|nr:50S ribosomal protein L10 [Candidatus Liberimonas magnetica]